MYLIRQNAPSGIDSYPLVTGGTPIKLSSKGQVVIPQAMREHFGWEKDTQIHATATEQGVMLTSVPSIKKKRKLEDLVGIGKNFSTVKLSLEELCAPVTDYDNCR